MKDKKLTTKDYQSMLNQSPMMIWMCDLERRFEYFNRKWLDFRGVTLEKETAGGWTEAIHPGDRGAFLDSFEKSFLARSCFELEFRLMNAAGSYRWVYCSGAPLCDSRGSHFGYIGTCVDIHDKVERERELEEEARHNHALSGIISICSECHRVRDGEQGWQDLEDMVKQNAGAEFSHTICPQCMEKLYPKKGQ